MKGRKLKIALQINVRHDFENMVKVIPLSSK